MPQTLITKLITSLLLKSLKGKKKWLIVLVLAVAYLAQSAGVELGSFVVDVTNILNTQGE